MNVNIHQMFTVAFVIAVFALLAVLFWHNRMEHFADLTSNDATAILEQASDDLDITIIANVIDVLSITLNRMPSTKELRKYHDMVRNGTDYDKLKMILESTPEYSRMIRMQSNVYGGDMLPKMTERQLELIVGNIYQSVFGHPFDDAEREFYIRKYNEFNNNDDTLKQFLIAVRTFEDAPPPSMGYSLFDDSNNSPYSMTPNVQQSVTHTKPSPTTAMPVEQTMQHQTPVETLPQSPAAVMPTLPQLSQADMTLPQQILSSPAAVALESALLTMPLQLQPLTLPTLPQVSPAPAL